MKEIKDTKLDLKKYQIFVVVKKDMVDLVISDKDFSKFRTLDQFIGNSGHTDIIFLVKGVLYEIYQNKKENHCTSFMELPTGEELIPAIDWKFHKYFDKNGDCNSVEDLLKFKNFLNVKYKKFNVEQSSKENAEEAL